MNEIFEVAVIFVLVILVLYVARIHRRMKNLERATRTLLNSIAPSENVRLLAAAPEGRIEAIRAFRADAGVDLREAKAVVDSLLAKHS